MEEFIAITTQAEFDERIKDRLARQQEKHSKQLAEAMEKYSDYDTIKSRNAELEKESAEFHSSAERIAELEKVIKGYEVNDIKRRVTNELGLKDNAIDFLIGDDEKAIRESAEKLRALVGVNTIAPMAQEKPVKDSNDPYKKFLKNIRGE